VRHDTRLLEQLAGQPFTESPLDEAAIRHGIEQRWQELAPVVERLPLSMCIVRAALDRVIRGDTASRAERAVQGLLRLGASCPDGRPMRGPPCYH
jgi:hypothetical protein